jgi:hypothetical protein
MARMRCDSVVVTSSTRGKLSPKRTLHFHSIKEAYGKEWP